MKIISSSEIEELPLPTIDSEGTIKVPAKLGRPEGKKVPRLEKEIIAVHSNLGVNQNELALVHNVSSALVSNIERGVDRSNLVGQKVDEELKLIGQQAKNKIVDIATTKIMSSLNLFEPSALEQKELPGAISKLANTVEKLSQDSAHRAPTVQFVVYQPRQRSEDDFGEVLVLDQ